MESNQVQLPSPVLSVVIPCYNEEEVIPHFLEKIRATLEPLAISYELVFVNDGSSDNTLSVLLEATATG